MDPANTTFRGCATEIEKRPDVSLVDKAAYLFDLAYQAVDEYLTRAGLTSDKSDVSRKSLGQRLSLLENDNNEEFKKAIKAFRSLRLRCERKPALSIELFRELQVGALNVVEAAAVGSNQFESRVPLGVHTVNSVSIETVEGYRYFHILHADVFRVPADLTIISTHANPEMPPSGLLVQALRKKGITVDPELIFQVTDRNTLWTCFQEVKADDCVRAVLTARMRSSRHIEEPAVYFENAVKAIFSSIASLEYLGHRFRTINLPLIYGQRIVDYEAAIESLLRNALTWLKKSDHTEKVNFVVHRSDELQAWDSALNRVLGRSLVAAGSDQVLQGLVKELGHQMAEKSASPLAGAIIPLQQALVKTDSICIENVCVFGRKLCELISSELIRRHKLKLGAMLLNNIETLRQAKVVAPWICSYLHSLRIFGNETVHTRSAVKYVPKSLDQNDLIAALSAIKSLLAFWTNEALNPESSSGGD